MTTPASQVLSILGVCGGLALAAGLMSNVNLFSLNSMYANRLNRCYLGASRRKRAWKERGATWRPGSGGAPTGNHGPARQENPFTGFDPDDDIPLWKLRIGEIPDARGAGPVDEANNYGPHLIMNTALNLVAGNELAWQDRKAESFVLTPTHCGSKSTGYAPTAPRTDGELSLGRAMSISGAAVDSNIGVHQSSALIALMMAFNARLGWWILNPNPATWTRRWWPRARGRRRWASSPSQQNATFLRAARDWADFQKDLLIEPVLAPLGRQIYPERAALSRGGPQVHAVARMIQVMENAWVDLRLGGFRDLPMNRGWMTVFRRWAATPDFSRMWPILRGEYSQDFVKYCETHLALGARVEAVHESRLDRAFAYQAIDALHMAFAGERPNQQPLKDSIATARETWADSAAAPPRSLLVLTPPGAGEIAVSPDKVPCGIVFASRVPGGQPDFFEVFLWMSRPYRGMGLASRCAKRILMDFLTVAPGDEPRDIKVRTRYPAEGWKRDEEMEFVLWKSFFSHYDFRSPPGGKARRGEEYLIERTFKWNEPEL